MKPLLKNSCVGRITSADRQSEVPHQRWTLAAPLWEFNGPRLVRIGAAFRDVGVRLVRAVQSVLHIAHVGENCRGRRDAVAALVAVAVACTNGLVAAQNQKLPTIGAIWAGANAEEMLPYSRPFMTRMRELGWIDGKTAQFIVRYYGYDAGKVPAIAKELIAQKVDVFAVTAGAGACLSVREATKSIPIVCMDMFDPVLEGATSSLARPNTNMTGVTWQSFDTAAKRVELAKDLLPRLRRAALITDAADQGAMIESRGFAEGAKKAGIRLDVFGLRGPRDLDAAIASIKNAPPDALIVAVNPLTIANLNRITALAALVHIPTVSEIAEFARQGILLTYGVNIDETYSRAAELTDRILKGAKPQDLPFEQPTKFDFVVNLKTAKALGVKIPESIMLRATEVIR